MTHHPAFNPVPIRQRRRSARVALLATLTVGLSLLSVPPASAVSPFTVTLNGSATAVVGEVSTFSGKVSVAGQGIGGQQVRTYVDGVLADTRSTFSTGAYVPVLTFTSDGPHQVQSVVQDGGLLEARSPIVTIQVSPPPAPATSATTVTDIASASTFIHQGSYAPQQGMAADTIKADRVAVLHGRVQTPDGTALDGVTVTVLDHPEYGTSTSTADGAVDLAVNGGEPLTLLYRKDGHVAADRVVHTSWRDYTSLPTVSLTPLDSAVTTISSGSSVVQVARGSSVTDTDGARRATLLVPADTQATMMLPNGEEQYLPTLAVRATEITVGENGPSAMPAELPPTSAYTYAVDFTVDQALAVDATTVNFDKPLASYTDNFLDFPVGTPVPAGFYDRSRHTWVAAPDGVVVAVVGATAGKADLDVTGDGTADTGSALTELGITDDERTKLATLYSTGAELWRVPIWHFTPWDYNWPVGLPPGATAPDGRPYPTPRDKCETTGSIIGCAAQTLGEAVPVAGTGMSLRYDTSRMPGFAAGRTLNIGLTGATVPPGLRAVTLEVRVAGTRFTRTFAPTANQRYDYTWDGRDAYGRLLQGTQTATVRIGYEYTPVFYSASPSNTAMSGSSGAAGGTSMPTRSGPQAFAASFAQVGDAPISGDRIRGVITVYQSYTQPIGTVTAAAHGDLGGWTLTAHHSYDVNGRTLHLGDGSSRTVTDLYNGVTTIAGNGTAGTITAPVTFGDGGPARQARLGKIRGLAVAPDGTVYLADSNNQVIRKINPQGVISTVAGGGTPSSGNGDGGPATNATLGQPVAITLTPAGELLIADAGAHRIRRVSAAGVISTFAGGGSPSDGLGDGLNAPDAQLLNPQSVTAAADGTVYIADTDHDRIRRITPDGIIRTAAGGGSPADNRGDGLPGDQAKLARPQAVAVDPAGQVYIADSNHDLIRKLTLDGLISTIAGTGVFGDTGDGGPATAATISGPAAIAYDPGAGAVLFASPLGHRVRQISSDGTIATIAGTGSAGFSGEQGVPTVAQFNRPSGLAVTPSGHRLIADTYNYRIRRLAPPLPGYTTSSFLIPSDDGSLMYEFNPAGQQLRTIDSLTAVTVLAFGYVNNRLVTITDPRFTDIVTTINRAPDGTPTSITAPFGQQTNLHLSAAGYLDQITNPANEQVNMTYNTGGLLGLFTDARQHQSAFTYDAAGRLQTDLSPDDMSTILTRTVTDSGTTVTATTAEGRTITYLSGLTNAGQPQLRITAPDGTTASTTNKPDGSIITLGPDGTRSTVQPPAPDPRFGVAVPLVGSASSVTPAGVTTTTGQTRSVTLSDPTDPLTVTTMTSTITTDGQTVQDNYTAATRTQTTTSPSGITETVTYRTDGLVQSTRRGTLTATVYDYDTRGRVTTVTQGSGPAARVLTYTYGTDGLVRTVTDPKNQTVTYTRDPLGRITDTELPDGSHINADYDDNGNLTSYTPPSQPAHTFSYTSGNQLLKDTPPALDATDPATTSTYNQDRQLTHQALPGGAGIDLGYDSAGRLNRTSIAAGDITLGYNSTTGALSTAGAPGAATLSYSYDGTLLTSVNTAAPVNRAVGYSYGTGQRATSRTLTGAATLSFGYDTDALLNSLGSLTLTKDSNGLPSGSTIGTGNGAVSTTLTADTFGSLQHATASTGLAGTVYDATYTPDKLGRTTTLAENVQGTSHSYDYSYDIRNRLTDVEQDGVLIEHYAYDSNDNRLTVTTPSGTTTSTYDDQDRLLTAGSSSYTYNARGQLATKTTPTGTTTYSYDELGHLTHVVLPNSTTLDYNYDPEGRRTSRAVNGTVIHRYLYGDGNSPIALLDGNSNVLASYAYARNGASPDLITTGSATYRIVADSLGSPRLIVNTTTGAIAQRLDYSSFGTTTTTDTNPGFQPFGYTGGLTDPDTGLVHLGARDYDPQSGRFTTRDPAGLAGSGNNLYTYVGNDPINKIDPTGLSSCSPGQYGGGCADGSELPPGYENFEEFQAALKGDWARDYCDARALMDGLGEASDSLAQLRAIQEAINRARVEQDRIQARMDARDAAFGLDDVWYGFTHPHEGVSSMTQAALGCFAGQAAFSAATGGVMIALPGVGTVTAGVVAGTGCVIGGAAGYANVDIVSMD